jgi:hypothetical protein
MDDDLRAKRDRLVQELRRWNSEDEPVRPKSDREVLEESARMAAEMKARYEAERIEQEVERRVQERLDQERAPAKAGHLPIEAGPAGKIGTDAPARPREISSAPMAATPLACDLIVLVMEFAFMVLP